MGSYLNTFSDKVDEENEECSNQAVEEGGEKKFDHEGGGASLCSSLAVFLRVKRKFSNKL